MVDLVGDKGAEDTEDGVNSKNPEKLFANDLSSKLKKLGLKNLDDLSKS